MFLLDLGWRSLSIIIYRVGPNPEPWIILLVIWHWADTWTRGQLNFGLSMYLDHTFARKNFAQRNHFTFWLK